jgi:DNA invertase Pin-like site-specific DNA recombinase
MGGLVTYLRVSTSKQGKSGLGIEAQREALARFAQAEGLEIVAEHLEVETGKGSDALERRPKLKAALGRAHKDDPDLAVCISGLRDALFGLHTQRHSGLSPAPIKQRNCR